MQQAQILALAGLRIDGRRYNEIRNIRHKIGGMAFPDGSTYFEQGLNKLLVLIQGPQEPLRRTEASSTRADIKCNFLPAVFSGSERKRRKGGDRRIQEMEITIKQTLEGVIMLDLYPRSEIVVTVHILESDGSLICAALNAICLALMDAGIAMTDMVVSCSAGIVLQNVVVDLNQLEQSSGGAYIPVAMKARSEEILLLQLDSKISIDRLQEVLAAATDGCRKVKTILEAAMMESMAASI